MGNNPFIQSIDPEKIPVVVYCANPKVGDLLHKCLEQVGFTQVKVANDEGVALQEMEEFLPRLVIIVADLSDPLSLATAHRIHKKRVPTNRQTPKVLALIKPDANDLLRAKEEGYWDIIPLPTTPQTLGNRLETVMTRID